MSSARPPSCAVSAWAGEGSRMPVTDARSPATGRRTPAEEAREPGGGLAVALWATLKRDLVLLMRRRSEVLNPLVFFALVITLFPIGISPDPQLLPMLALAKVAVHWLLTGLPLSLMAPVLGIMLSLPAGSYVTLAISLALGTASLSLIGAIGAALTVGLSRGGVLLSLLVLPLYIPVLIFGAGAVQAAILGDGAAAHLAILGALLALALMLAPWAMAASLRISING